MLTHSLPDEVGRKGMKTPETALLGCLLMAGESVKVHREGEQGLQVQVETGEDSQRNLRTCRNV